jgi:hypothetical protein
VTVYLTVSNCVEKLPETSLIVDVMVTVPMADVL